jgi:hypothetical protein
MLQALDLAGSFTLPGTSMTLKRMGYGAMQLAGAGVWGPPRDVDTAIAVLTEGGDRVGRKPHRYQRLLRSACHESTDQARASSLQGRSRHRHQSGCSPKCG